MNGRVANNGVVLLSGKTDSFEQKLRAVEAARGEEAKLDLIKPELTRSFASSGVAGVQRVATEIQVGAKGELQ